MRNNIKVLKGDSNKILVDINEKFDFIYIDGCHKLIESYTDILLSFNILNKGGIIAIDDYLYNKENILESPYHGVNHFLEKFKDKIKILDIGYRIFLEIL